MKIFALALALSATLTACGASPKQVATVTADNAALLCKLLPPLDAAEEAICAAATSADEIIHKFAAHEKEIGVERLGSMIKHVGSVASASPSASASPAASGKAPSKP